MVHMASKHQQQPHGVHRAPKGLRPNSAAAGFSQRITHLIAAIPPAWPSAPAPLPRAGAARPASPFTTRQQARQTSRPGTPQHPHRHQAAPRQHALPATPRVQQRAATPELRMARHTPFMLPAISPAIQPCAAVLPPRPRPPMTAASQNPASPTPAAGFAAARRRWQRGCEGGWQQSHLEHLRQLAAALQALEAHWWQLLYAPMQMQRPRLPASPAAAAAAASLAPLLPAGGEEAPLEATLRAAQPPIACLTSTSLSSLPSGLDLDSDSSGLLFEFESGCFAGALPPTPRLAVLGLQASSAQPGTPSELPAGFENSKPPTALERLKQAQRRVSRTSGSLCTAREASSAEACRSTNALVALKRRRLSAWGMYPAPPIC